MKARRISTLTVWMGWPSPFCDHVGTCSDGAFPQKKRFSSLVPSMPLTSTCFVSGGRLFPSSNLLDRPFVGLLRWVYGGGIHIPNRSVKINPVANSVYQEWCDQGQIRVSQSSPFAWSTYILTTCCNDVTLLHIDFQDQKFPGTAASLHVPQCSNGKW